MDVNGEWAFVLVSDHIRKHLIGCTSRITTASHAIYCKSSRSSFSKIPCIVYGFKKASISRIASGSVQHSASMAGLGNNPVQIFATLRDLHWEFLRLWTGFELPSSCRALPCYAADLNRNILDFMRWSQIDLGVQDLNDI
jgi:hypothetical protein